MKTTKLLITIILTITFLVESSGVSLALRPMSMKVSENYREVAGHDNKIPWLVDYEIKSWELQDLISRIDDNIEFVQKASIWKLKEPLREKILKELNDLKRDIILAGKTANDKKSANFLLDVGARLKNIIKILDENKQGSDLIRKSIYGSFKHIQRLTIPQSLFHETEKIKSFNIDKRIPETVAALDSVLEQLYGVTLDEIIQSISLSNEFEIRSWVPLSNARMCNFIYNNNRTVEELLMRYVYYTARAREIDTFSFGSKAYAYLIHYFAVKTAKEKFSRKTSEKSFPSPLKIATIFFDVGNVLLFWDHHVISKKLAADCNMPEADIYNLLRSKELLGPYEANKITPEEFFRRLNKKLKLRTMNYEDFKTIYNEDVYTVNEEGVGVLKQAKAAGYKIYFLSDVGVLTKKFWIENYSEIFNNGDGFIASCDVGVRKPDSIIYKVALKEAGCKANESIFIDDLEDNAKGADAVGINSFHYHPDINLSKSLKLFIETLNSQKISAKNLFTSEKIFTAISHAA